MQFENRQRIESRHRHIDRVAGRLFSIGRYWIETVKADPNSWFKLNLTDSKRPRLDTDGHAIRVLDQMRTIHIRPDVKTPDPRLLLRRRNPVVRQVRRLAIPLYRGAEIRRYQSTPSARGLGPPVKGNRLDAPVRGPGNPLESQRRMVEAAGIEPAVEFA